MVAHSIKNIEIKHALTTNSDYIYHPDTTWGWEDSIYYLCIGTTSITPQKVASTVKEVTCKNCLRKLNHADKTL